MKGAFLVSSDPGLFSEVRDALVRAGATATPDGVVQLRDDHGRLLTLYGRLDPAQDWEWREGPFAIRGTAAPPEMTSATACWVECRWETMFAEIMHAVASQLQERAWVLDGDGVLWPASEVNPAEVRL